MTTTPHSFDQALVLESTAPGLFRGHTSPAYWNMVGPFGGITAATALRAILLHPDRLGDPLSLTVNYAGALSTGPFTVQATPVRTNRSTQHWTVSILQTDAQGEQVVTTTATAVTAVRRETWSLADVAMPEVPTPEQLDAYPAASGIEWFNRYDIRPVTGALPRQWNGQGDSSLSQVWMRDNPARPLDFCALAALADVFFPRVWLRRAVHVPAGTVSITVYFHASPAQLEATGTGHVLGQARAQEFRNGFFDQTVQLWSESGTMLATSHQIVYYKE